MRAFAGPAAECAIQRRTGTISIDDIQRIWPEFGERVTCRNKHHLLTRCATDSRHQRIESKLWARDRAVMRPYSLTFSFRSLRRVFQTH